jgi:putative acetyltransferase
MSTPNLLIRDEAASDYDTISTVTEEAFRTLEVSGHTEQYIVEALRQAGALTLSLIHI